MAESPYCKPICQRDGCLGNLCPFEEGFKNLSAPATTREDEIQEEVIYAWRSGLSEQEIKNLLRKRKVEG